MDTCPEDALIRRLDSRITGLKHNRRMEERYMLLSEMLGDERKEGYKEGESRILKLIGRMKEDGLDSEIPKLAEDPEFLEKMFKKYQLDS